MSETLREVVAVLRREVGPTKQPHDGAWQPMIEAREVWALLDYIEPRLAATAPTSDEVGLVEVLASHRLTYKRPYVGACSCKAWTSNRDVQAEHEDHLARAVQGYVEGRVERASIDAYERGFMKGVDVAVKRTPDARRSPLPASQPTSGPEDRWLTDGGEDL